jgi:hypothetical protein
MDIVDMAIHLVVCRKSDFHGNSYFQNSKKLDPLQIMAKKTFRDILVQEIDPWCITKVE